MVPRRVSWLCCVAAVLSTACAGRFDPAHFEGSRGPERAEPEAVLDVAVSNPELESLGNVRDTCTLRPGFRPLKAELLSDLDCSTARLLVTLHESASSAGGEVLIGAKCSAHRLASAPRGSYQVSCSAEVARYRQRATMSLRPLRAPRSLPPSTPAPSASEVLRINEPDASLAFRIRLNFEPEVQRFQRRIRAGSEVHELSVLPLSHRSLGDLAASCEAGCDERALRYGVLIAAGRLGVPDVVGVRCFRSNSGRSCVGTLAAPERDE